MTGDGRWEEGSATVEFVLFAMLLLVPLTYVLLVAFDVQRAAYGTTQAAREAARAFVTSPSSVQSRERAQAAVMLALGDQGLDTHSAQVTIDCTANPCLTPGATVIVRVEDVVTLPWVPSVLGRPAATVLVRAAHAESVDVYSSARP